MLDILICFSNELTLIIIVKIFNNSWIKVKPSTCRLAKGSRSVELFEHSASCNSYFDTSDVKPKHQERC